VKRLFNGIIRNRTTADLEELEALIKMELMERDFADNGVEPCDSE